MSFWEPDVGDARAPLPLRAFFNMQTRGATAPLVMLHSPPSDSLWPTAKLVGGGGISPSIMFELYSHILDYKLQ